MKKLFVWILSAVLLLSALCLPAAAAHVSAAEAIAALETLELVRGTGSGFEPERTASRSEAAVMLLRLLGRDAVAEAETGPCPFSDGGWASNYLTYAYRNGLVHGVGDGRFGSTDNVGVRDYLTMVLRALGYTDSGADPDFTWAQSIAFADAIGLTHGEYKVSDDFLREDMVLVSYTALTLQLKNSEDTLIRRLYLDGAVSGAALKKTRLAFAAVPAEKQAYDAAGIHELSASAVFFAEMYDTEEHYREDKPAAHGSGFFVTADGIAVMCCHELNGFRYVRVTTLDGRRYALSSVLSYDPFWDTAVVRVSRTDDEGSTLRFFPYLELGNSDGVYAGEHIYTVSNPLGHVDSVSDGIVANCSRFVDDPDYLMLQITAPISQGSSGGPVMNCYGEVEGIIFGMFLNGQNLNLAIPVNQIDTACFSSAGITLEEMYETEKAKQAAAALTVSEEVLQLNYEERAEIFVTSDYPGTPTIQYQILSGADVIKCDWGAFETKHTVPLYITGIGNGEAEVEISYDGVEGNNTAVTIHVTVTGAPETQAAEE